MSFKLGCVVIGQHFEHEMAYLNGLEGVIKSEPVVRHVHGKMKCYGIGPCQEVAWCDGSVMAQIPVKCLREKKPPADTRDTDTEWAKSLVKKITAPVKEPELVD